MVVQPASIYAICLAVGRPSAGYLMRRLHWSPVLSGCMLAMGATVLLTPPLTRDIAVADRTAGNLFGAGRYQGLAGADRADAGKPVRIPAPRARSRALRSSLRYGRPGPETKKTSLIIRFE
jgi:hypothetical protein